MKTENITTIISSNGILRWCADEMRSDSLGQQKIIHEEEQRQSDGGWGGWKVFYVFRFFICDKKDLFPLFILFFLRCANIFAIHLCLFIVRSVSFPIETSKEKKYPGWEFKFHYFEQQSKTQQRRTTNNDLLLPPPSSSQCYPTN